MEVATNHDPRPLPAPESVRRILRRRAFDAGRRHGAVGAADGEVRGGIRDRGRSRGAGRADRAAAADEGRRGVLRALGHGWGVLDKRATGRRNKRSTTKKAGG